MQKIYLIVTVYGNFDFKVIRFDVRVAERPSTLKMGSVCRCQIQDCFRFHINTISLARDLIAE